MRLGISYVFVVLVWSTTPLAIQWSASSLSYLSAITARMVFACLIFLAIFLCLRKPLVKSSKDYLAFFVGALGLFPNMCIVYWSAQYIPSGLISVILGFFPFAVGFFSWLIMKENLFNMTRVIALIIALLGLFAIHFDQLSMGPKAILGVLGIFISSLIWAVSTVWLKAIDSDIGPFRQGFGTLIIAAPCFAITWWVFDGIVPKTIDTRSVMSIAYLVVIGSLIGHTLYFFVLSNCSVAVVSLIPLITPMIAVIIGIIVADESLGAMTFLGTALIVIALGIYQFSDFKIFFNLICRKFFGFKKRVNKTSRLSVGILKP